MLQSSCLKQVPRAVTLQPPNDNNPTKENDKNIQIPSMLNRGVA
jgi:hypothetical protein